MTGGTRTPKRLAEEGEGRGSVVNEVDVFPVGLLANWQSHHWNGLRRTWRYVRYQAVLANWRAVRNTFNGYLAEHDGHAHNCGKGWTRRAAIRRVDRLCTERAA